MSDDTPRLDMTAFFTLHRDLPREGPGEPADIEWAAGVAGTPRNAQMADVGCGPGADIGSLLSVAPEGHVTALDKTAQFVEAARERYAGDGRVTILRADMARIKNQYDLIWCAGAVYFLGVTEALSGWRKSILPGGVVAFSEACWFTEQRPERAQAYFAAEYPTMTDEAGVLEKVSAAGYEVLGTRRLQDAAWEAYFQPIEARIAMLRAGADAALTEVLDEAEEEIAVWRAHRDAFGYLLTVARPA
ncbi:trans-aconitate 2-methyltransferase [Marimonas sp. MJW-29]|uniref:Trans-aconitate 2-methyltransferase n=1 Tax=Sulfitobacter sediminis TaxID=3234186 RepID=A0ABV3RP06_9RHOB